MININRKHKVRKPGGPQEENYFFFFRFSDIILRKGLNKNSSTIKHSKRKKITVPQFSTSKTNIMQFYSSKKHTMDEQKGKSTTILNIQWNCMVLLTGDLNRLCIRSRKLLNGC